MSKDDAALCSGMETATLNFSMFFIAFFNRNWTAPWNSWNLAIPLIYVANGYSNKEETKFFLEGGQGLTPVHACSHMGTAVHP